MASIGKQFMDETQMRRLSVSEQERGVAQPPLELARPEGGASIDLPKVEETGLGHVDLLTVINTRRTLRKYAETPLSLAELSFLLWCTQGVQRVTSRPATLRPVPSAGARHAFETYLMVNRVDSLAPGLYRFMAIEHQLAPVDLGPTWADRLADACGKQEQVRHSAVTFAWTAVLARMRWRYGERGYRYLHLDAGHICQNLYLAAESIGCGACAIAAYDDEQINALLGLDGIEQFTVYLASLGKRIS